MGSPQTLKTIRKEAPEQDRNVPALVPSPLPELATARDGSSYVVVRLYPRTLNELRRFAKRYGRSAVREAEWSCLINWLMNVPPEGALTNPLVVVNTAVLLVRDYERIRFGWPRHDGEEWTPPAFDYLSPDVREEALRVAAETLSDWREAGRPHLEPHRIKGTYQYLISCPAFIHEHITKETE